MPHVDTERTPAVAGRFYPSDRDELAREVTEYLGALPGGRPTTQPPRPALGLVAPHAGYVFSGAVAGATYARVTVPDRVIVLGPNHTGDGRREATWPGGDWRTPLGAVPLDEELTGELVAAGAGVPDRAAHRREHSLEVQLPFLQLRQPRLRIAALCLGPLPWERCAELGSAIGEVARRRGALVVASSDMSHYLPAREARRRDALALERILALDPRGLLEVSEREDVSMCGRVPAAVMLVAALAEGAREAELVRYAHSGEVTGDDRSVVGYAGVVVS